MEYTKITNLLCANAGSRAEMHGGFHLHVSNIGYLYNFIAFPLFLGKCTVMGSIISIELIPLNLEKWYKSMEIPNKTSTTKHCYHI